MNKEVTESISALHAILKKHCSNDTTSVRIFINAEGCEIKINKSIKIDYISMRNLKGEFIK